MILLPSHLKPYKKIDLVLQTALILLACLNAAITPAHEKSDLFLILFVLFAIAQISSFFIHYHCFKQYRTMPARKVFKVMLITHHVLILPSALMLFIPLMFTSALLCVFYYGLTIYEYVRLQYFEKH